MKVAFVDTVHEALWNGLTDNGFDCYDCTQTSIDEIISKAFDFEGIVVRSRFPMNAEFLDHFGELKFIARSGAGMENIDLEYCERRSIQLFNAPEGNRNAVAEHALGMLLCMFNKIHTADREVRSGIWDREGNRGVELDGKKVGIIGYGNNGAAFAKKLKGFDVEVLAYDKYKTGFENDHVKEVSMDELMYMSDVVSLHIPQNEETLALIDATFIKKMKKPFYLINLSRGKIVKTADLLLGINDGKVLGACLDVLEYEKSSFENMFENENMSDSFKALLNSEKVLLSPHVGGWTVESYQKLSEVLLAKILAHYKDELH
ncbi:phosphoglycerate dehydrogenase [Paracrocinitomix mangrovi]|uniref:NAD(P)-dependent oxidoreductase n=1 Tax=Paracrocinitomix mangrovi TaxID=2862509 RepID=UPI001C8D9CD0|nr:NAD(P)-dependent oxidoreductase [Paracrocinitomix mangrovi]UKN03034.1 phosphoglycerate dehydrogenase [Paracrocinitomix mangrovi]